MHVFATIYNLGTVYAATRIVLVKKIFIISFLITLEAIYVFLYGLHIFLKHTIN